ncbi:hypothetical protein H6G54_15545 [Anabaena cylindrica FACHB-243]|uniref:Cyanovirin-N domain protein n=1 Tax=Anabaena cylindrica (strain ATCC 27899 / PCC 7122) TaxID=272123 RepID=K9ZHA9_ANACC|nr:MULTISPECIES: hypothetical protein [Anabaena]AFZ58139.1 hypothetical protein Anacy_2702 [Anabaena cylindrica PCC 7122]MBD2419086.1 hypothetical protein [Anabaena cylindrica FACHB-243]MBY5281233.1 hypothetical protein [Anabaena sp. CCAP 1446/1C]MBY5310302.1 hypothetical protein [Anabaena sp. CCAP 1446/1C]MCM2409556.1 hypothetical protein [Anabaena sp. CCAP 1446/1C]
MLKYSQALVFVTSLIAIPAINLVIHPSASASIVCEPGTVSNYSNGSLASCILGQDTTLQISTNMGGLLNLPCKAKNYISFDDKGQFTSCRLSEEIQIRKGDSVQICLQDYLVQVSSSKGSGISITCRPQY